ncbi:MAG: hypothetical protein LBL39_00685, partial [Planctomycetaceae bacterium]|nr:hypothetical protein [Planctomycetaceae bacterium]
MKRLSLNVLLVVGLFFIIGFTRFAKVSTFAAPPISPELRWYQPPHSHQPVHNLTIPYGGHVVHANGGIAYPLSAAAVDSGNVEYAVAPRASTQVLPAERIPVMRSRSGRYYTIAPSITTETIETVDPNSDSYAAELPPTLAPPLQTQQQLQPPQTSQKTPQQPQQPIFAPSLPRSFNANTNSEKNIPQPPTEYVPQLDELNARLAKMQLEKKNLEGTLRSIDKIEDVVFKVQTLVDLAEYVSRDKNYKKEADYLLD